MIEAKIKQTLQELKNQNVDYADIRYHNLDHFEHIHLRDGHLKEYNFEEKNGYGIRVLYRGAWGFYSSEDLGAIKETAKKAFVMAQNASGFIQNKVQLAKKEIFKDQFKSRIGQDPFETNVSTKIDLLKKIGEKLGHQEFEFHGVMTSFYKRNILFFDTEGSEIEKHLLEIDPWMYAYAKDKDGENQCRSFLMHQKTDANSLIGLENLKDEKQFIGQAPRIKEELLKLKDAPINDEAKCSLIPLQEMMALQTHETIGHALELDRILGYELSYAGGSHIDLEHFNKLKFGSEKLTSRASGIVLNSPGSTGYDDDGVKARDVTLIKNGLLVNAITSRQMVVEANNKFNKEIFKESAGACRAQSYNCLPIERMNNINIDPGEDGNLEEIISKTQNGLLVETPRSWSIGANRENFHFACEIGWKIKDGEISHMVRNPTYKGDSLKFWNSLDMVGDKTTWQLQQVFNCGKGQPNQVMHLAHGVPICRFDSVEVGNK